MAKQNSSLIIKPWRKFQWEIELGCLPKAENLSFVPHSLPFPHSAPFLAKKFPPLFSERMIHFPDTSTKWKNKRDWRKKRTRDGQRNVGQTIYSEQSTEKDPHYLLFCMYSDPRK